MSATNARRKATLDLGCGTSPRSLPDCDTFGIDIGMAGVKQEAPGSILPVDLNVSPIPFDDSTFCRVFAHDFLEHVPRVLYVARRFGGAFDNGGAVERRQPFLELMGEIWRVLEPGGIFESCTPLVTDPQTFWGDPTHVNAFSENCLNYFCAQPAVNFEYDIMRRYGFKGQFRLVHKSRRHGGGHLYCEMEAQK